MAGSWEGEAFCYLTTAGRVTARPHTIEIWFAARDHTLYLLSGGGRRSDWVRNIERDPEVEVRIGERRLRGTGRLVTDPEEEELARSLVHEKYRGGGDDLSGWRRSSLPVAIDLRGGDRPA